MLKSKTKDIYTVKPIENLQKAKKRFIDLCSIKDVKTGIIGGGPSAVEIACNIRYLTNVLTAPSSQIHIITRKKIFNNRSSRLRNKVIGYLKKNKIEITENKEIKNIETGRVVDKNGEPYNFDIIFLATGVKPSTIFKNSNIATGPDGGFTVNRYLQSISHPNIFGGGDCIYFQDEPLDKVGVYAIRQNKILKHNLMAYANGWQLKAFSPGARYLSIFNMGDGNGLLYKKPFIMSGRPAFLIKDFIDKRFMKKYK